MKRASTTNAAGEVGAVKAAEVSPQAVSFEASPHWAKMGPKAGVEAGPKADKQQELPAPPPVWTRYIDSRLKQFCTR